METLRGIAGIGMFPALSLVLFVSVFAIVIVRAACMDRASVRHIECLPLDECERDSSVPQEAIR